MKKRILLGVLALFVASNATAGITPKSLNSIDSPADEECLTYDTSSSPPKFEWQNCGTSMTGDITLENLEVIDNGTNGTINFGRNDAGTVTIGSIDNDTTAALTIDPGGTTTLTLGGAADTVTVAATTGLTLANTESVNTGTDATFDFTRNDAGVVTFTCSDDDATAGCTYDAGGASPIVIGSADVTTITLTTDGTGTGEVVLPASSVAAGEIVDITRSIPLPLDAWVNCTTPAALDYTSGADDDPDISISTGVISIKYDDTGGSIDADEICTTFTVPADYASGGSFVARLTQDAATTEIETFSCRISVDGAAVGAANAGNNVSQTAVQSVTSTPAGTWAAGASIAVSCKQGNASADDVVSFHSIEGQYTATQ